jgi:hypothetical protein
MGRQALLWLKKIFSGAIFLEFPNLPDPAAGLHPSIPFWFEMYREGLIDVLDCEDFCLSPHSTREQIEQVRRFIESMAGNRPG